MRCRVITCILSELHRRTAGGWFGEGGRATGQHCSAEESDAASVVDRGVKHTLTLLCLLLPHTLPLATLHCSSNESSNTQQRARSLLQ